MICNDPEKTRGGAEETIRLWTNQNFTRNEGSELRETIFIILE